MKKPQVLLALALAFSLGLATPAATYATDDSSNASIVVEGTTAKVGDEAGLFAALEDANINTITLTADIALSQQIDITRDIKFDLGGYTLSSQTTVFNVQKGALELHNGVVSSVKQNAVRTRTADAQPDSVNYASITIAKDVTVKSDQHYAVSVGENAYGVTVDVAGTLISPYVMSVNGKNAHTVNAPKINIADGAVLEGGVGYATASDPEGGVGIYAAGYAEWTIGAAKISGDMGFAIKSGKATFNNTTIEGKGEYNDSASVSPGIISTGAAIQIEENVKYAGGIDLEFNGGTYTSDNTSVFMQYQDASASPSDKVESIVINSGTFNAKAGEPIFAGVIPEDVTIKSGKFNADVNEYSDVEFIKTTVDGKEVWMTQADIDASKPVTPVDPSDPEIPEDVKQIRNEIQAYLDKIKANETYKQYQTLIQAVNQAEERVQNWDVATVVFGRSRAKASSDADLIVAIGDAMRALGSDTKLGENLPANITKADLEAAIAGAKGIKNYQTYSDLVEAVKDAEAALADNSTSKDDLKEVLARLAEISKTEDPENPNQPIIPGVNDINSSNGSTGSGNTISTGAPETGTTGLNESIQVSAITCIVSGVLLATAIIARRIYGKRKADKAEREFVKL